MAGLRACPKLWCAGPFSRFVLDNRVISTYTRVHKLFIVRLKQWLRFGAIVVWRAPFLWDYYETGIENYIPA